MAVALAVSCERGSADQQIHAYQTIKRLGARSTNWILSAIQQADKLKNCLPQYLPLIRLNVFFPCFIFFRR